MHQNPRPAPRSALSANNPQTNPARTNNQRQELAGRTASSQSAGSESERSMPGSLSDTARSETTGSGQDPELARLNLIVQHFFSKAALIIASSRVALPPLFTKDGEPRLDKWFNTWLEDTSALSQDLQEWKTMEAGKSTPPPLVMEVYLDTQPFTQNQSLVAIDDAEKRWDVNEALKKQAESQSSQPEVPSEVVYERWTISLDKSSPRPASQPMDAPPNVYKKGVVLLRSLFTYTKFLPAWRLGRRINRQGSTGKTPKAKLRILGDDFVNPHRDTLTCPLFPANGAITEDYHFAPLPCAFGDLKVSVTYRSSCNFEVDAAERLLSARFVGGSLELGNDSSTRTSDNNTSDELPQRSGYRPWSRMPSTGDGRADESSSRLPPDHRTATGSKSSLRSEALPSSLPRRPSVSFQPFKAGSLSSSPASGMQVSSSPSSSLGRTSQLVSLHSRSRSSLNALPQQALRTPALPNEMAVGSSASSSPKPAPMQRYSSSFSNRRARFPSSAGSKTEEDNNSSRGSVSSTQRGSGTLNEGEGSSSVPAQDDSESIGDFLKMLDKSSRGLSSFIRTDQASLTANSQRTAAQYSKFARMRDSTAQLSDSMSSSLMLQRSSTSSSRQLSNVPGLVGGVSLSTSSSPGKPVSPHTPHMPAVPSRLSNNSIADYTRNQSRNRIRSDVATAEPGDGSNEAAARERGGIDIPNSPRIFPTSRRSSSVHHNGRVPGPVDEDVLPFGLRSASLPNDERPTYPVDDDEPLLFAMGELGTQRRLE